LTKIPFRQRPPGEQAPGPKREVGPQEIFFIAVSLVVIVLAQNDLRLRPASRIRGNKTVWRAVSLNALGALVYLCFGRDRSSD
jgi:hypothetical protein